MIVEAIVQHLEAFVGPADWMMVLGALLLGYILGRTRVLSIRL